jgi:hypothetical protein
VEKVVETAEAAEPCGERHLGHGKVGLVDQLTGKENAPCLKSRRFRTWSREGARIWRSVLFGDDYFHPGAGEKKAKHHAGRSATDDAAPGIDLLAWRRLLLHRAIPSRALMAG